MNYPTALTPDGAGNIFFLDGWNARVRKISPDGTITPVAGNGQLGSAPAPIGDGGPATGAALGNYYWCDACGGLAVDKAGNLYIADAAYAGVREVSADGIINTIAGTGTYDFSGNGGPATAAKLWAPTGVAVDGSGNVFIADPENHRVRKTSPDGTITTVAGNGSLSGPSGAGDGGPAINAELSAPLAVALDSSGNLYIVDPGGYYLSDLLPGNAANRLRMVSPDGIITTLAGTTLPGFSGDGGPASTAALNSPVGVAVDGAGNVYVADSANQATRMLHPTGRTMLIGAVFDAARENVQAVSSGEVVVIYGAGLGPAQLVQGQPGEGCLGTDAGGTSVSFNGILAPVLNASATQVAVVVPYGITGTMAQVTVSHKGEVSPSFTMAVAPVSPSLFTLGQTGVGQAAAITVANGKANTAANPVRIGDYITLYATGEGQTNPPGVDGQIVSSTSIHPSQHVTVTVDGIPAYVQYAGEAPGMVAGVMQLNVQIPIGVRPGGYVPVVLQVGSTSTTPGVVWIAVSGNQEIR